MISVDLGVLAAACSQLTREDAPQSVLDTLLEAAPAVLPGCDHVSVTPSVMDRRPSAPPA